MTAGIRQGPGTEAQRTPRRRAIADRLAVRDELEPVGLVVGVLGTLLVLALTIGTATPFGR